MALGKAATGSPRRAENGPVVPPLPFPSTIINNSQAANSAPELDRGLPLAQDLELEIMEDAHNAASGPPHTPRSIGHKAFRPGVLLLNAPANADYSVLFLLLSNNDLPRPSPLCIPTNVVHHSSFNASNEGESDVRPKPPNNEGIQSQVSFFSFSFFFLIPIRRARELSVSF